MNSEQPLLTIGIPTWNRSKELQECIQLVAAQIETCGESVEIFVSDNASSDGTEALLCEMETRLGFLRHSRNESNVGADRNFIEVLKRSSGKYVWLFSDDDFMTKGSLAEILRIIKAYEPAYITTNWLYCDNQQRIVHLHRHRRFMAAADRMHVDINQAFMERNHSLSLVSCNIYQRDILDVAEYEANANNVANWIQVYITAHVLSNSSNGYLASFYAVLCRDGNRRCDILAWVKGMPESFSYILNKFNVDKLVHRQIMKEIVPFRRFLTYRYLGIKGSQLLLPNYYKFASLVPRFMIPMAWRIKRFLWGRGFSLPEELR